MWRNEDIRTRRSSGRAQDKPRTLLHSETGAETPAASEETANRLVRAHRLPQYLQLIRLLNILQAVVVCDNQISTDRSCYRQEMEQILMQERAKALRMQWALEANKNERGLFLMAKLSGTLQAMLGIKSMPTASVEQSGLLPVWWTPPYANSACTSNSMGLRYPSVECRRRGL